MKKLSCIIPCYNEEAALPYFLQEIRKVADNMSTTFQLDFEILFINDGSRDKTLQILRQAVQEDKRIRYISFARNFGKEAAMYAGFQNCTGEYAAVMDACIRHYRVENTTVLRHAVLPARVSRQSAAFSRGAFIS